MPTAIGARSRNLHQANAKRPFTVQDSIAWRSLVPFTNAIEVQRTDYVLNSPDNRLFAILDRGGDSARGVLVSELSLFSMKAVQAALDSPSAGGVKPLLTFQSESREDERELRKVRWIGSSALAFLAPSESGALQLFELAVPSGALSQKTSSDTDVVSAASSAKSTYYYACAPKTERQRLKIVTAFSDAFPKVDAPPGCYGDMPIELFVRNEGEQRARRLPVPPMFLLPDSQGIWPSPSGRYAVVLVPATNAPSSWSQYQIKDYERFGFTDNYRRSDPTSTDLMLRLRYVLVDSKTGSVTPLLDAPSGAITFNYTPPAAFWSDDETSLILSNSFLPLEPGAADLARRRQQPATLEVDLASGATKPIIWEPVPDRPGGHQDYFILGFDWNARTSTLIARTKASSHAPVLERHFARVAGQWREIGEESDHASANTPTITLEQGPSQPPMLVARAPAQGRGKKPAVALVYDPNPQSGSLSLASAKLLSWTDENGRSWRGGLLLPRDYQRGRRYPLVVQSHGFEADKFLVDGPAYDGEGNTAFSAQALSSAGFAVLQVADNFEVITGDSHEGPAAAAGYAAAIRKLVGDGIADPREVGFLGFSRTGYHALFLLARYPGLIAAATISDSIQAGYADYLYALGDALSELEMTRLAGGKFDYRDASSWFTRNPLYRIGASKTPIRIEAIGNGVGMWETFSMLREAGAPTEYEFYPDGSHLLKKPDERLASEGGTVDWFRFWLQGYEDPDRKKADQYRRWRLLRNAAQGKNEGHPPTPPRLKQAVQTPGTG